MSGGGADAPPPPAPPAPAYAPYPTYSPYPPQSAVGTNGFAIASLVCSLVACGVGSVLAIVFGHVARSQIKKSGERGNGLAIAGLVVGYVGVVAIIGFIAVVAFASNYGPQYARDDARAYEHRLVAYARLTGKSPRDPQAIARVVDRGCCDVPTIGDTGVQVRGTSTFELDRAGWRLQFEFAGEPGIGRACLTVPATTTVRASDVRAGACRPLASGGSDSN